MNDREIALATTPKLWKQGRLLDTVEVRRMTATQQAKYTEIESRLVVSNFDSEDGGRSRNHIAECSSPVYSRFIAHFDPDKILEMLSELEDISESNKAVESALEDVPYSGSYADGVRTLIAEIEGLKAQLKAENDCQEALAVRILGKEPYDNSPCQAHPLELVEQHIEGLKAQVEMARETLQCIVDMPRAAEGIRRATQARDALNSPNVKDSQGD